MHNCLLWNFLSVRFLLIRPCHIENFDLLLHIGKLLKLRPKWRSSFAMEIRGSRILNLFPPPFINFCLSVSANMEEDSFHCRTHHFQCFLSCFEPAICPYWQSTTRTNIIFVTPVVFTYQYHVPSSNNLLFIAIKQNVEKIFSKTFILCCSVQKYVLKPICIFFWRSFLYIVSESSINDAPTSQFHYSAMLALLTVLNVNYKVDAPSTGIIFALTFMRIS